MAGKIVYLSDVPTAREAHLFEGVRDVLDVKQVAELLGVCPATVRREIARGRLDPAHIGTSVRVTKSALLRYLGEDDNGVARLAEAE